MQYLLCLSLWFILGGGGGGWKGGGGGETVDGRGLFCWLLNVSATC